MKMYPCDVCDCSVTSNAIIGVKTNIELDISQESNERAEKHICLDCLRSLRDADRFRVEE